MKQVISPNSMRIFSHLMFKMTR
jgi:hypothetical protein